MSEEDNKQDIQALSAMFAGQDDETTQELSFIEKYTVKLSKTEANGFAIWQSLNQYELKSDFIETIHGNMLETRKLGVETNKDLLEVVKNKSLRDWFEKSGINFNFGKGGSM